MPEIDWHWKDVSCPTCNAPAGESCGKAPIGRPWGWMRVPPHVARKRAACKHWCWTGNRCDMCGQVRQVTA